MKEWNDKFSSAMLEAFNKISKDFNCKDYPYIWNLMGDFCKQSIDESALSLLAGEVYHDIEKYREIYTKFTPSELYREIYLRISDGSTISENGEVSIYDIMNSLIDNKETDNEDTDNNDN